MPPRMVIGVDLDGVCGDYEDALRRSVARQHRVDPAMLPPQQTMDAYSEWGLTPETFEAAHRRAVEEDRIFRNMKPMPDVAESLWRLSDQDVWIRLITHRLLFNGIHEVSAADTAWWLDHHNIPYRDLCFIGDKPDVGADLYVDDSPTHIVRLRQQGCTTIVFDQPYNRALPGLRAARWVDIVAYVEDELAALDSQATLPIQP